MHQLVVLLLIILLSTPAYSFSQHQRGTSGMALVDLTFWAVAAR